MVVTIPAWPYSCATTLIPAMSRRLDCPPSAATSSGAASTRPSLSRSRASPAPCSSPAISAGAISSALPAIASSRAPTSTRLGTICANGSPGATSPAKLRNSGRAMSPLPESVIFIERIGSASPATAAHTPSASSTRVTPADSAEARWSRGTAKSRRSTSAMRTPAMNRASASARLSPTGPPPTMMTSKFCCASAISASPCCPGSVGCISRRGKIAPPHAILPKPAANLSQLHNC